MSSADPFVRHHHRQTDHAISDAFARTRGDDTTRASFQQLLIAVRRRAPALLSAPITRGRHPGVEALFQLARVSAQHVRTIDGWTGSRAGWRGVVAALAQHLLAVHPVPAFLAAAWHAVDENLDADAARRWFIEHGRGRSVRSLDVPIRMSRRMEHLFLQSPAHADIATAMRRAELLALGATPAFADAILGAAPARRLSHGDFWRTAWIFLIGNAHAIPEAQVQPLIDFFDGVRHQRMEVETPGGLEDRGPQDPHFSLEGRTVRSVLRLMAEWHRLLGRSPGRMEWGASPQRPMFVEQSAATPESHPTRWELVELTTAAMLRQEGAALKHCVASYGRSCATGRSRIWSLRRRRDGPPQPVLTIEVDPLRCAIVQVRGLYNRRPAGRSWQLVQAWARREQLRPAC